EIAGKLATKYVTELCGRRMEVDLRGDVADTKKFDSHAGDGMFATAVCNAIREDTHNSVISGKSVQKEAYVPDYKPKVPVRYCRTRFDDKGNVLTGGQFWGWGAPLSDDKDLAVDTLWCADCGEVYMYHHAEKRSAEDLEADIERLRVRDAEAARWMAARQQVAPV
ncbi:MAG: hypothetical protein WC732_09990, partial [Candidatus Omnitrophota bacterium]